MKVKEELARVYKCIKLYLPIKSTTIEFPSNNEKPNKTHGRYGASKFIKPKKLIRTYGFLRLQIYTNMMVKACPKNTKFTNKPIHLFPVKENKTDSFLQLIFTLLLLIYFPYNDNLT